MDAKDRDMAVQDGIGPTISVVICTRNRPDALFDTLRSLRTQSRRADELLILDDGELSHADRDRIAPAAAEAATTWRIVPTHGIGLTASRNLAARFAQKGDILLFLDDDLTCEPHVVAEIARLMSDPRVSGVTATVIEPAFRTRSGRLFQWGYRVAGWWRIGPRGVPAGPRPALLQDARVARRARWLSGAVMALRRDVVLANPFDETLAAYALGEDREMGYRLAPSHWLLESRVARVVHRRDGGGRTDPYKLGVMTARNYAYILRKTCDLQFGDWLLIGWSFLVLSMMHAACALLGRASHWDELRGLLAGVVGLACDGVVRSRSRWRASRQWHTDKFARDDQSRAFLSPVATESAQNAALRTVHRPEDRPALIEHRRSIEQHRLTEQHGFNVLFVTNRLTHGGAERMLLTLVTRLPALGITPVIACLQDAGPLAAECEAHGVVVHHGILRHKTDVAVILRLRQIIEAAGIDVVTVAHSGGDRMFWPTLAATVDDIPVVVWSHWFPRAGVAHIERPNRALYRLINSFVALGEAHKAALVRHEHVPSGRITIIRNGIELAPFESATNRDRVRAMLGLVADDVAVGLIANLRPEKRHDLFIQAAAKLSQRDPNLRYFIIGDGPDRRRVEALVQDAGLDGATMRLLGARDDTAELLRGLDIACLCSDVECMPVVMLEAAAAGCAFIGPNTGCVSEFLVHRENGLLVNASDGVGLADAISELSADPALRGRIAAMARERLQGGFDAATMARRFASLLRETTSARRGRTINTGRAEISAARPIESAVP